ncbi:stage II sporulation protein M [Candidatus Obscuribacterales bacterium]|nr:stage II sporulation protein M [Candidatus Obscuribacterales bacterium]
MNVERWLKTRRTTWEKLEELLKLTDKQGVAGLDRQQLQELGRLYRTTSADLSRARALKLSHEVQTYLNNLVVRAHNQVYQTDRNRWLDLFRFLWVEFPRLIRENILYLALSTTLFLLPAVGSFFAVTHDVKFAQLEIAKGHPLVSEDLWNTIQHRKMWTDAVQDSSPTAFSLIATNNIRIAIMAFVFGITFGVGTVYVLIFNGISIGTVFGLCHAHGMAHRLSQFVAPHGVLELMAIFISGAAGLVIGKSLLFPGQYKRIVAFRRACKTALGLFSGTVPILFVAGCIEGFVSPRTDIQPDTKYLVSVCTGIFLMLYLFIPRGAQGDMTQDSTGGA